MKVKTSELQGAALDWAVAKCEGIEWEQGDFDAGEYGPGFKPSTYWEDGGPIIEREKIGVWFSDSAVDEEGNGLRAACWYSETGFTPERADETYRCETGPTPLIAAMRCFVASKLGDEVEIPEVLNG